jgi:hypothetical protein
MDIIELNLNFLEPYFDGRRVRTGHKKTVQMYKALKVHADGEFPEELIHERRPNESAKIQKYRRTVFKSITKSPVQKVITSLTKIRRSVDWGIIHPREAYPSNVPDTEHLSKYTGEKFPRVDSFENWLFSICFKNYILDANGVVLYMPINRDARENEYLEPVPFIFNSPQILEYRAGQLLIVKIEEDTAILDAGNDEKAQKYWLAVNSEVVQKWAISEGGFVMDWEYKHNLGMLPAIGLGGQYKENAGTHVIRESRISPMLERLDEAAREYSDMQAEVVQHIHSERWQWATQKCTKCTNELGIPQGFINDDKTRKKVTCPSCDGMKTVAGSPYTQMVVRPSKELTGESAAPIPPAGYITKETKIVEIQDQRIDEHIFKALSSINMQFIDKVPQNISGRSKEVDREELNNFVYGVAQDLVNIARKSMEIIAEYRYRIAIKDEKKRKAVLPDIKVPEKFDLLSSSYLSDEISRLKEAGANPVIIAALEKEYAAKKFYNDPSVRDLLTLILDLDPLASVSEEDKMIRRANKGITDVDYVISSNITELVREAAQDSSFISSPRDKQMETLRKMAEAKMKSINSGRVEIAPDPEE